MGAMRMMAKGTKVSTSMTVRRMAATSRGFKVVPGRKLTTCRQGMERPQAAVEIRLVLHLVWDLLWLLEIAGFQTNRLQHYCLSEGYAKDAQKACSQVTMSKSLTARCLIPVGRECPTRLHRELAPSRKVSKSWTREVQDRSRAAIKNRSIMIGSSDHP